MRTSILMGFIFLGLCTDYEVGLSVLKEKETFLRFLGVVFLGFDLMEGIESVFKRLFK